MKVLFILNDAPYGTERVYNALRLAHALVKKEPGTDVTTFLMADAVVGTRAGQKTPYERRRHSRCGSPEAITSSY
ncbi:MAG: DsrE family protein [Pseudolabrys sp.]|jgi:uncharacterized protein involved in oxidation of intracellular sulfur